MFPDRSLLKGQKLVENAKIEKFKCDILEYFQTMLIYKKWYFFVIFKHCGFKDLGAKVILLLFATENPRVQIAKSVNLEICRQEKLESCPRSSRTTRVLTTDGTIFFSPAS